MTFVLKKNDIKLFSTPFDIQVDIVQKKYQIELVELQCNDGINIWQHLCVQTAVFLYESTKSKLRTQFNDGHLQDLILLATSNLTTNLNKLSSQKQH